MINVGRPLKTPDDILVELPTDDAPAPPPVDPQVELAAGAEDEFEAQERMLSELGVDTQTENSDGSVTVSFGEEQKQAGNSEDFGENLANVLDNTDLRTLALECINAYKQDIESRREWEEMLARGLKLLGMSVENRNEPWSNACGVFHPVLLEAVVRGWAKSVRDLAPARGPAKAELKSKKKGVTKRLKRVTQEFNCIVQNDVPGYAEEQSRMSFMMHLSGAGFKKIYFNSAYKKIDDRYVHPFDLVMPYGTTDIDACPRICHRQDLFPTEVKKFMDSGMWRTVALQQPATVAKSEPENAVTELNGAREPAIPTTRRVLEFHIDLMIQGDSIAPKDRAVPYLIVVDETTQEVLNLRRNWKEGSDYERRRYFVAYQYVTGYSVYGIGMVHMIGGLTEGATSILRQLVDAGTLANLPAGFKARGFRVKGDDQPLKPGEWRDVDFPGQRIEDAIMPLPFKEPSAVLAALLDKLIEEARRTSSVIDAAVSDIGKEAPVGSVLAILEESLVIQNSVKIGMLRSLDRELNLIKELAIEHYGKYRYEEVEEADFLEDFSEPLKIIPAADPNASSMAQKVVAYREAINTAQAAPPNTYDMKELHRRFLEAMEIPDAEKIVPLPEDAEPYDPVTENMKIIQTSPVKVFDHQNHEAHLQVHLNALQDPLIQQMVGQSPNAQAIMASMTAHINEHVAYLYRSRIEQLYGQALPDPEKPLPPEVERAIAPQLAQASAKLLEQSKQQDAQQKAQALAQDPVVQIKQREVAVKEKEQERKGIETLAKMEREKESDNLDATIRLIEVLSGVEENRKKLIMDTLMGMKELRVKEATEKMKAQAAKDKAKSAAKRSASK